MTSPKTWIEAKVKGFERTDDGTKPPFRYQHTFTMFDDTHVVVFGGRHTMDQVHQDTHVLNVKELTQNRDVDVDESAQPPTLKWEEPVKSTCPSIFNHGFCAVDDKVFSFGGKNNKNQDTQELYIWKYDTQKWSRAKQTVNAPSPRFGVTCTPVSNLQNIADEEDNIAEQFVTEVIVFGGGHSSSSAATDEFHSFNPESLAWNPVDSFGPKPTARRDHTATAINNNTFIIFGGKGIAPNQSHSQNTHDLNDDSSSDDDMRYMPYSSLRSYGTRFTSEKDIVPLNDAYLVQILPFVSQTHYILKAYCHKISYKTDICPEPRYGHSAASVDGNLVIMGGTCGHNQILKNDIWILYTQNMEWVHCDTQGIPPRPRFGHGMVVVGSKLVIWGGFFVGSKQNSVHILDIGKLESGITEDTIKELMQDAIKDEQEYKYDSSSSSEIEDGFY